MLQADFARYRSHAGKACDETGPTQRVVPGGRADNFCQLYVTHGVIKERSHVDMLQNLRHLHEGTD